MIAIIDYGIGNILSVYNAVSYLGYDCTVCNNPSELLKADKLILPGVGAFSDCVSSLKKHGFKEVLDSMVLFNQVPILGICVGMQMMGTTGFEMGEHQGLGWIEGAVRKINFKDSQKKIPNVGWENLEFDHTNVLFKKLPTTVDFYFVHSYHLECIHDENVIATYNNAAVTAAINRGNIFGTQFHPEKSSDFGLQVIENFLGI
jgi:imidazole glycerol-phosphate synthase subunit HisH